jgi:histidinol phosphatase-like PHP family hydrolase
LKINYCNYELDYLLNIFSQYKKLSNTLNNLIEEYYSEIIKQNYGLCCDYHFGGFYDNYKSMYYYFDHMLDELEIYYGVLGYCGCEYNFDDDMIFKYFDELDKNKEKYCLDIIYKGFCEHDYYCIEAEDNKYEFDIKMCDIFI